MVNKIVSGIEIDSNTNMPVIPKHLIWEVGQTDNKSRPLQVRLVKYSTHTWFTEFAGFIFQTFGERDYRVLSTESVNSPDNLDREVLFAAIRIARQYYDAIEKNKHLDFFVGSYPPGRLNIDPDDVNTYLEQKKILDWVDGLP